MGCGSASSPNSPSPGVHAVIEDVVLEPDMLGNAHEQLEPGTVESRQSDENYTAGRLRAKTPQITRMMMAPTTAPMNPAPSPGRYQPIHWPR